MSKPESTPEPEAATGTLDLPKWDLCFKEAKAVITELGLEYYTDQADRLNLMEALHLILPRVMYGTGIPEGLTKSPWRVSTANPKHEMINELLDYSTKVQMGHIPKTEFSDFILSNACLAQSALMCLYLETIEVKSSIVVGILQFSQNPNSDGAPHVWLELGDETVDNAFVFIPPGHGPPDLFFKMKAEIMYAKENPETTKRKLFFADEVSPHSLSIFNQYSTRENLEKYLVSCFRTVQVNPCIKMYDIVMRDYLQRKHQKVYPNLEEKWNNRCWSCQNEAEPTNTVNPKKTDTVKVTVTLKACSVCRMAKYCGPNCQKKDWKIHKLLHHEIEHATLLKAKSVAEAAELEARAAEMEAEIKKRKKEEEEIKEGEKIQEITELD